MVNRAVSNRADEILAEQKERQKEYEERKASGEATKGLPKILSQQSDVHYLATALTEFDDGLDMQWHRLWAEPKNGKNGYYRNRICMKTFEGVDSIYSHCDVCESRDDGVKSNPSKARALIMCIHDFIGKTYTPDESKPEKTYAISPVRVVMARYGHGGQTIKQLKEDVRLNHFRKALYDLYKTGEGAKTTYSIQKMGKEFIDPELDTTVPKDILEKYAAMSPDDIAREILANFENPMWDLWEVEPPVKKVAAPTTAEPAKAEPAPAVNKGAAKKALD